MNWSRAFALLICAGVVGCGGGSNDLPRGPVKGRITMDGKPLAGVTVVFENKGVGVAQTATTDSDGRYDFVTYGSTGLPAASYKVTVSAGRFMQPGEEIPKINVGTKGAPLPPPSKPVTKIPDKYAKADTSGLSAEVKAGDNPSFDFDLKQAP